MPTYEQILSMSPENLIEWLHDEFHIEVPQRINSIEEMDSAAELLLLLTGHYAYLAELLSYAKIAVRKAKRTLPKEEWEDMVDKKEAIERRLDISKQQYAAVSRAITVKSESNRELMMSR